jgi:CBS domain-containing protein
MARAVAGGMDVNKTRIHDLLTAHPAAILPATSIGDAARTIVSGRSRQLPAAGGTSPAGIVDIAGVCGALPGPPAA